MNNENTKSRKGIFKKIKIIHKERNIRNLCKNLRKSTIDDISMNQKTKVNYSYIGDLNNKFGIYRQNISKINKKERLSPFKNSFLISVCNNSLEQPKLKYIFNRLPIKRDLPIRLNNDKNNVINRMKTPIKRNFSQKKMMTEKIHKNTPNKYEKSFVSPNFIRTLNILNFIQIKKINFNINSIKRNKKDINNNQRNNIIFPYLNKTLGKNTNH